jgi:hypothetical protein
LLVVRLPVLTMQILAQEVAVVVQGVLELHLVSL